MLRRVCVGLCALGWLSACTVEGDRPAEVDLLVELPGAERRGAQPVEEAVRVDVVSVADEVWPALVMQAPARVSWPLILPRHARLSTAVVLVPETRLAPGGIVVRIGMSDGRRYQDVRRIEVTGDWQPVTLDLREYSEVKFSLFYQPLNKTWRLVFNADATPGGTVAWARPVVTGS